ncbi:hypothetical protein MPH_12932 [Macrophomina phaseolina MS6]|uniref:Uncharacterized protein n=1 Tax=Macrophomina phaseolina (strain MS6) TaxID=1126212 RepID=K2RZW0_MACPH|nr:hypothetical protein MPH_12932 [Macrophomina phaseolina MS6]
MHFLTVVSTCHRPLEERAALQYDEEKITSEFTYGILEYSCELYILSLINQIGPRVSLVGSASYGEEDVGTLDKWCDNTWHTLTGNPIDDGELERKGEIELARPDPFFRSDVDAGARFAVVYETRWRRKGDEDWGPVVRWKRVFMTGDQACEGYLWGAKQGWSIPFVYDELPAQELNGWRWSGCCEKVGCPRDHHLRMLGQY